MVVEVILKAVIGLPLIFFIPGYLIINALNTKKISLKFSETIFVQMLISIIITSFISIFLAEVGLFSLINLTLILLALCIILIAMTVKKGFLWQMLPKFNYEAISLISILLILLILIIVFPVSEWIIGTYDAGVYVNSGVNIARTGSIGVHDQLINKINENDIQISKTVNNFDLTDIQNGYALPMLYNMFPVWIAIFYSIFGIWGAIYVASFFGALGILSIYMVTRQISNWQVATISSLFLSLNFIQLYFSRTPYTEVMTQYFIFSGLFTFIIYKKSLNKEFAIISAMAFALTMFVRIDSYILLIPFFAYNLYLKTFDHMRDCDTTFVNTFCIASFYSMMHTLKFNTVYNDGILKNHLSVFNHYISSSTVFYIIMAILFIFLIYINYVNSNTWTSLKNKIRLSSMLNLELVDYYIIKYSKPILLIFTFIFVVFMWFIRPYNVEYSTYSYNAYNLVRLSQFLSPFVMACGVGGILLLINSMHENGRFYVIGLFLIFFVFFIINVNHSPPLPWMMRRYLPVVIPSIIIFAGYFIYKFIEFLPRNLIRKISIILIVFVVSINYLQADSILHEQKMWDGMIDTTEQISDFVGDDILVFGHSPTALMIASPIKLIYGKNVIYMHDIENPILLQALNNVSSGKKIYVTQANTTKIIYSSPGIQFVEAGTFTIPLKWMNTTYEEIPSTMDGFNHTITVYELIINNDQY